MKQITLRVPDELAADLKRVAGEEDRSVNALAVHVLQSAVDPEYSENGAERTRERLRRAGLLMELEPYDLEQPSDEEFEAARRRAGTGKPLSDYISEGRGPR